MMKIGKQIQNAKVVNGRWTKAERGRFMKGFEKYGKNWVNVQKVVRTRSVIQVRSHAQKQFSRMSKKDVLALIDDSSNSNFQNEQYELQPMKAAKRKRKSIQKQKKPKESLLEMFIKAIQDELSAEMMKQGNQLSALDFKNSTGLQQISLKALPKKPQFLPMATHETQEQTLQDNVTPFLSYLPNGN